MIKEELIQQVSQRTGRSDFEVKVIVDNTLDCIKECLKDGGSVIFRKFGTFAIRERAPKTVRNISTGERYTIGWHKRVVFEPGVDLKNI